MKFCILSHFKFDISLVFLRSIKIWLLHLTIKLLSNSWYFILLKGLTMADCIWEQTNKIIYGIKLIDDYNLELIIVVKSTTFFSY